MSLDRMTLAAYFGEIGPRLIGRRIEKVRPHGRSSLKLDLSSRDALFLDVSRPLSGMWLVPRAAALPNDARLVEGPSRSAALLFKKHLEGQRIESLSSGPSRLMIFRTRGAHTLLRPFDSPGLSLIVDDTSIGHFGSGDNVALEAGLTDRAPDFEAVHAMRLVREIGVASRADRHALLLARDPGLLPLLRRWPDTEESRERLARVLSGQTPPRPYLGPGPGDDRQNLERPPKLTPFEPDDPVSLAADFAEAASRLYVALRRADLFRQGTQSMVARDRAEVSRLRRLEAALDRDRGRWPDSQELRRQAEALLAAPPSFSRDPSSMSLPSSQGRDVIIMTIPDPRSGDMMDVRVSTRLTLPQNANALYERARNIEQRKNAFEERWNAVVLGLAEAEQSLASALAIRSLADLEPGASGSPGDQGPKASPLRYLSSRGLEILFGRSAAENHEVTFKRAKREDIWFHVKDAPGGHVILRNREGRANRADIEEAASVAAFLSERRTEGKVDVQFIERKHVHPSGGGRGRVRVAHAEVIRVAPRDPSGRLRARRS